MKKHFIRYKTMCFELIKMIVVKVMADLPMISIPKID